MYCLQVMDRLLEIPEDYWINFISDDQENHHMYPNVNTPQTPELTRGRRCFYAPTTLRWSGGLVWILWKHFISWGRNFVVWRRRTYSWVLDFVDCPAHEIEKKIQNYCLQFLTDAKLRPNTETWSIGKLRISEWLCLLSYVTPEDIDPRQPVNIFTAESHQTTFMTPNCQLACHLRDYIHKDVRGAVSFKGLI